VAALIDGKKIATDLLEGIASDVARLGARGVTPGIAVVLVGDDPASEVYVRRKVKQSPVTSTPIRGSMAFSSSCPCRRISTPRRCWT
jgi:5,10-methylene-tetrahydrofolate dehydrogenase/methenyl tetrahydrofolate cyclohydrolase